jgi:predicted SnoaL-like aldol condensation-catalyzing enzyme
MTNHSCRGLWTLVLVALATAGCVTTDRNKAVASRAFAEILDQGRLDLVPELYAPDFRNHGLTRDGTLAEDMEALRMLRSASPKDAKMRVQLLVAEGDYVSVLWTADGTYAGGRRTFRGITIWKIVDGRISEEWSEFDEAGLLQALGLMPAPGASPAR